MEQVGVRATRFLVSVGRVFLTLFIALHAVATTTPPASEHPGAQTQNAGRASDAGLSQQEKDKKSEEEDRIYLLSLKIMENFGCSDFTEKGVAALVDYLYGQVEFPAKQRTRVPFTEDEYARKLTGHFRLLNYTEATDTPESKIIKVRSEYSEAFRELSKIMNEDLYKSYGNDTDFKKIANDLSNPKSRYGSVIKQKLKDALAKLSKFSGVDYLNVGCRVQGEPVGRKKNKLAVQLSESDAKGNPIRVHLDAYLKRDKVKKEDVVDSTVPAPKKEPKVEVAAKPAPAPAAKPAPAPADQEDPMIILPKKPAPAKEPKVEVAAKPPVAPVEKKPEAAPKKEAPHAAKPTPAKPPATVAQSPAPKPKPAPAAPSLEERAKKYLPKAEPQTKAGKGLFSRFESWMEKRDKDSVSDFHATTLKVLKQDSDFVPYLINRNPFGALCTNYTTELTVEERERVLSKALLVHLLTENFDNPSTENLGSYETNSIGPWQTSMNSRGFGCTFKNQDEIRYNLEKNIHCNFKFYTYREKNYDQIWGKGKGLHWSVFIEGNSFEKKFEPLFREAVPECKNNYSNKKDVRLVNGHSPATVKDFINSAI